MSQWGEFGVPAAAGIPLPNLSCIFQSAIFLHQSNLRLSKLSHRERSVAIQYYLKISKRALSSLEIYLSAPIYTPHGHNLWFLASHRRAILMLLNVLHMNNYAPHLKASR